MLDIKSAGNGSAQNYAPVGQNNGDVPRPKPPLEFPDIEEERNYTSIFAIISVVIVVAAAAGLYILQSTKASALKSAEDKKQSFELQLGKSPLKELNKQILSLQNGIKQYDLAISGGVSWSKVFTELEKTDPKNVMFTAFSLDENQLVKLGGDSSDYGSLAKLIRSLENSTYFVDVKLISSTVNATSGLVNFVVSFNVDQEAVKINQDLQAQPVETAPLSAPSTEIPATTETVPAVPETQTFPNQ